MRVVTAFLLLFTLSLRADDGFSGGGGVSPCGTDGTFNGRQSGVNGCFTPAGGGNFTGAASSTAGELVSFADISGTVAGNTGIAKTNLCLLTGDQTVAGIKTLSSAPVLSALSASLPICTGAGKAASSTCTGLIPWADIATGNNYRVLATGSAGVPGEAAAITASKGLCSDANGIPVACASGPSATEMTYVTGLTSAAQTQLNAKEPTVTKGDLTASGGVTATGGTGAVIGSGAAIACTAAADGTTGCMTGTDHTAFTGLKVEQLTGFLEAPTDKTYVLDAYASYAYTINTIKVKTVSGTTTLAVKINGTSVTGISAVSVSSTIATGTASAANSVAAGDRVTLVLSSSSSPVDLEFTLKYTR